MLEYARWKYVLVLVVLALALLLALPNLFGDDPALQVARKDHDPMLANSLPTVEQFLKDEHLGYTSAYLDSGQVIVRFADTADQFKARDAVNAKFADQYITALSFASRAPTALRVLGLRPMKLGLDLRGGLYLLYQVDTQSAIAQLLDSYAQDLRRALSEAKIPYSEVAPVASVGNVVDGLRLTLAPGANVDAAQTVAEKALPDLPFKTVTLANGVALQGTLSSKAIRDRQDYAIEQNLVTLRNRVSQLGVAEPIVQRQSGDRINVQLPGVLNSAEVKDLLSKVASLEFRLNATTGDPYEVASTAMPRSAPSCTTTTSISPCCSSVKSSPPVMSSPAPRPPTIRMGRSSTSNWIRAPGIGCWRPPRPILAGTWRSSISRSIGKRPTSVARR